ncbi:MAG TPA: UDP-N-acetylmuramate dehydrogenase [Vicinamibacterales bacterium]|nr:UDP-N-acetylmuramate dehydrogenase [Vicinamibacterales bacterium]
MIERLESRVPLAPFSTLGVGGAARWLLRAIDARDVAAAHEWCESAQTPLLVLGGGSNLVVADEGWHGLVLHIGLTGIEFRASGGDTLITAAAGEPWDRLVAASVERSLAGIECLSGIPGSVGGTPIQNVGAYGQEVGEVVESVSLFDRRENRMRTLGGGECRFAYRMSRFKSEDAGRFVVCGVTLRLAPRSPTVTYPDLANYLDEAGVTVPTVGDVRQAVLAIRRRKGMVLDPSDADTRSVGSFFMNPVVPEEVRERISSVAGRMAPAYPAGAGHVKVPAAWLIEQAGFRKGDVYGGAAISTKHPLAIVNRRRAKASDVVHLATRIKRGVMDRFGVALRPEPVFVGFAADPEVEYLTRS